MALQQLLQTFQKSAAKNGIMFPAARHLGVAKIELERAETTGKQHYVLILQLETRVEEL